MTKKKTMKNIKTSNKFNTGGFTSPPELKPDEVELIQTVTPDNLSFGEFLKNPIAGNLAGTLGGIAGGLISNGFSTTGGQILSGIGDVAGAIPVWGPFIKGAAKVLSGAINASFGTKWNNEGIAKAESQITGLNNFQSGASDFNTLTKDFNKIGSMNKTIKASDLGEDGWAVNRTDKKAEELNTNLGNAYNYAMRNANNVADNISKDTLSNLERNYAAFGGPLFAYGGQTHGADFTNGLMFINNGGTHENNPYEGVPISMDQEGNPNLVEEGEVIWNDYVFSNRLKVPKSIQKKYKLGKKEMTFANAIDKLSKESEERPNDPISMRGLENIMMNMAIEQEQIRANKSKKNNQFATGGPYDWSNFFSMLEGYNGSKTPGNTPYTYMPDASMSNIASIESNPLYAGFSEYVLNNPTDPDVIKYLQTLDKITAGDKKLFDANGNLSSDWKDTFTHRRTDGIGGAYHLTPFMAGIKTITPEGLTSAPTIKQQYALPTKRAVDLSKYPWAQERPKQLKTWMRYAPVAGYGISALTDLLGLTNKPDYSNANAIIKVANNLSSDPIKFRPIGDYLTYNPFDTEYHANQLRAVSGATRRNIMNTSGGNRATAMAGILTSDNNTMNQMGDLYRKAAEYNLEQKHKVADFNKDTNKFNSEGFFKADAANQSMRQAGLEGLIRGYTMKEQAKLLSDQAKSANLSGLFTSLGNIGYENANRNMMNWGMLNGTWAPSQWKYDPLTGKPVNQNG